MSSLPSPRLVTPARPARVELDRVDALHVGTWLRNMSRSARPSRDAAMAMGRVASVIAAAEHGAAGAVVVELAPFDALSIGQSLRSVAAQRRVHDIRRLADLKARSYVEIFEMFARVGEQLVNAALASAAEAGR